jgi:pyridoxal phosphate enzyme (YggS family)
MTGDQATTEETRGRIAANIAHVRATIAEAAQRAGRQPEEITLVAVSKTKPLELVQFAFDEGVTDFGENRAQDALPKIAAFHPTGLRWHMIGHVQTNKGRRVAEAFDAVQSVDSLHLAQALNRYANGRSKPLPILLQVNVSGEANKEGMTPEETPGLARQIAALPALEIQGLMTIAPLAHDPEEARPSFRGLRQLRDQLRQELPEIAWLHLSMGMTDDYAIAIAEGATIVRVGRAIFGERVHK